MMNPATAVFVCCFATIGAPASAGTWIAAADYARLHVVVPAAPNRADREAADLFVSTWEQVTGHKPSVSATPGDGPNVWIGASALPTEWKNELKLDTLGFDGILLKTIPAATGKTLVLTGGEGNPLSKGTLFAVYEFFERCCGVRWLTPDVTHIPAAPKFIPTLDYRYTPPMQYRNIGGWSEKAPGAIRENSPFIYGQYGHSLYMLLPPDKYFAEHPEYYSEIKGKRIATVGLDWENINAYLESTNAALAHPEQAGQLCMSNPATAEAIAHEIEARMKNNPNANVWSVSQMDWGNNCTCAQCRAIDEAEGTPAGSFITGVNRVAELIEKDHPGVYIQTYAYTYTRRPPKTIRPRHNVIVQFCSIECDFARSFDDPESKINRAFVDDLLGWEKLGANILIYNYPVNCTYAMRPYPYEYIFAENMRFFAKHGVIGVYEQGQWDKASAFGYLKPYVMSRLQWDPSRDVDSLVDEFCALYYGPAAPHMRAFFDLCHDTLRKSGAQMPLFDDAGWLSQEFVTEGEKIFRKAFAAADTEEIRKRVDLDYFQVQYAAHLCKPTYRYLEDKIVVERPPHLSADELMARLDALGIRKAWPAYYFPLDDLRPTLARPYASGTNETPLIRLENDRYFVWVAPELQGSMIRWRDKKLGIELLKGFETCGTGRGTFQEWSVFPGAGDGPSAPMYVIKEKSLQRAVIEGKMNSGFVIERTMSLDGKDGGLHIETRVTNAADAAQPLSLRVHPEFYCQRVGDIPEFWVRTADGWKQTIKEEQKDNTLGVDTLIPDPSGEWAVSLLNGKYSLVNAYDAAQLEKLIYFYNTGGGMAQVNLELVPPRTVLQPGESYGIEATYRIEKGRPSAWAQ
ncbi:MAG TPA: DUF4838 domain-containing protein [Candidatus Hydrogenedentes bacterium]|nr:DUF4838 domain-containing protein [Candidatus Hydrogenedentota bacterium]